MPSPLRGSGRRVLERTLAGLRRMRGEPKAEIEPNPGGSAATLRAERSRPNPHDEAFRAVVYERLRSLERQLDEVKGRVNGLIFLLAGAVAAQLLLQVLGRW